MTGLFHLLEGHHPAFTSRRYNSIHSGHRTQGESQSLRHDHSNDFFSKVDDVPKNYVAQSKEVQHHRSHSDVVTGNFAMTPSRPLPGHRRLKDGHVEAAAPPYSSESRVTDPMAFYSNETLGAYALFAGESRRLDQTRKYNNSNKLQRNRVPAPKPEVRQLVDSDVSQSADIIRDAILASFKRLDAEGPNLDQSLSNSNQGEWDLGSVRRDGSRTQKGRTGVDLPRSLSVFARSHEQSELVNWKEGLRSSPSPHRKLSHHNSPERRVELRKRNTSRTGRYAPINLDQYPRFASMSTKGIRRVDTLNPECDNFKESPGASDFRESLRPFLTGTSAHRNRRSIGASGSGDNSSDGNLEQVEVCHQMSGCRKGDSDDHFVVPNVIARLMGLEGNCPSSTLDIPPSRVLDHAKARGGRFFRGLVQFDPQNVRVVASSPSPPPSCHWKKSHNVVHLLDSQPVSEAHIYRSRFECTARLEGVYQGSYPAQYKMEQELFNCEEGRDLEGEHHLPERPNPASRVHLKLSDPSAPRTTDSDTSAVALGKKKKMIRRILEAMRPKVLRRSSSHHKQTDQQDEIVISPDLTKVMMITNDVEQVHDQPLALEKQQQSTLVKVITGGLKLFNDSTETQDQSARNTVTCDTSSVKQLQEEAQECDKTEYSMNGTSESSAVRPQSCGVEPGVNAIVVMKPTTRSHKSSAGGKCSTFHVDITSSNSTDTDHMVIIRSRTAPKAKLGDKNQAKDQRRAMIKPVSPRVRAKSTKLEPDYESDPSSLNTQNDKLSNNVRESAKKRNPSSKNPPPDNLLQQRQQRGRCLTSPDAARPSSRSSPIRDHHRAGEVDLNRKSDNVARTMKVSRPTPTSSKQQSAKDETTLTKRLIENLQNSSVTESRALEKVSPKKERLSTLRGSGPTRALSPAAPRRVGGSSLSSPTTDAVIDQFGTESCDLNLALPKCYSEGSEPVLEPHVSVQPESRRSNLDPHVHNMRHFTPPEVQNHAERDESVEPSEISLAACSVDFPDDQAAQPLVQILEASIIEPGSSEELKTPQGFSLEREDLHSKLLVDEGLDLRPSPISVLDANNFDSEELNPSPSSPGHTDSGTAYITEGFQICGKQYFDELSYSESSPKSALLECDLNFDGLLSTCAERLQAQLESNITDSNNHLHKFQSYFKESVHHLHDETQAFVDNLLNFNAPKPVELLSHDPARQTTANYSNTSENLLATLQSAGMLQVGNYGHKLLLDCLEEIMERITEYSQTSSLRMARDLIPNDSVTESICVNNSRFTDGSKQLQELEQALWVEVRDAKVGLIPADSGGPDEICHTVHRLLRRDFIRCQGREWTDFVKDNEEIGVEVENLIVQDLVEEAVREVCVLQSAEHVF